MLPPPGGISQDQNPADWMRLTSSWLDCDRRQGIHQAPIVANGAIQYHVRKFWIRTMAKGIPPRSSSSTSTAEIQQSTPGSLRSLLLNGSQPTLLLGAGASVTSGIPAAEETAEKAARWAWCHAQGRSPDDIKVLRSDYWPWLLKQPWYSENRTLAEQYPQVIGKLLGVKRTRRDFFERLISPLGIQPSVGYRSLARILHEGWVSTVLTTNFDHCLDDARILENKPHLLVSIKTPDDLIRFNSSPKDPQLVYLHGSVEHYSDKNLDEEIASLEARLVEKLMPVVSDHPIIVVGYRGAEASIMKRLFLDQVQTANHFPHGVYWCVRETDLGVSLTPFLQEFATRIGANFQLVPIKGFDELFEKDLWNHLAASGELPIRRIHGYRPTEIPPDMKPVSMSIPGDLDKHTLHSRLIQYAKRLGIRVPDDHEERWLESEIRNRNLITEEDETPVPTLAGWLLFARAPQSRIPQALVRFRAKGPVVWIKRCFGDDAAAADNADAVGEVVVEQEIVGNLWSQLDTLTDLLSLVNQGFRLKEEVSRTAYPFAPLAIKETLVNALVHRDYALQESITVEVAPGRIEVISPGGLIAEVKAQTEGKTIEDVIAGGTHGIKGYRNPVISDLFYGGGQMDRAGSGLADLWLQTVNNNGEAHFGPNAENTCFKVVLLARPEAVDEITNTATAKHAESVRYAANLLPIHEMPKWIWHAGTTATSTGSLFKAARGLTVPPGYVQDRRFFTLYDLAGITESFVTPFDIGDVECLSLDDVLALPNGENIVLKLLNDAFSEHLRALGLYVEFSRRRAHFRKSDEGERKITYKGRVKQSTRTVVKTRLRRDTTDVLYYEHKAVGYSVVRFGADWAVAIMPGYAFTRDGEGKPINREKVNILSTKRAARDFNPTVHHDVTFWSATLSEGVEGLFALKQREESHFLNFGPTILFSSHLPTITFNTSSFGRSPEDEMIDAESADLEAELVGLAEQPEEDLEVGEEIDNNGN